MPRRSLPGLLKDEFIVYSVGKFRQDWLAGLTVATVALPLALAFGAAAGLVTAIVAGFVTGFRSGAPDQISGPMGAMSAGLTLMMIGPLALEHNHLIGHTD